MKRSEVTRKSLFDRGWDVAIIATPYDWESADIDETVKLIRSGANVEFKNDRGLISVYINGVRRLYKRVESN